MQHHLISAQSGIGAPTAKYVVPVLEASVSSEASLGGISCHGGSILSSTTTSAGGLNATHHQLLSSMLQISHAGTNAASYAAQLPTESGSASLLHFRMPYALPAQHVALFESDAECAALWTTSCVDDSLVPSNGKHRPVNGHVKNMQPL